MRFFSQSNLLKSWKVRPWSKIKFNMTTGGKLGLTVVIFVFLTGVISGLFMDQAHQVPSGASLESPSWAHPLGTDDLGIDLWAQICHGAGISMLVGFGAAFLAGVGGSWLGILAGYYGKWADRLIMGLCDVMMVIPQLPMMIVFGAFFGSSLKNIIIVIAVLAWTGPARTVRARILSVRQDDYIRAAQGYGAGFFHLAMRHFIPAVTPIMMVSIIRIVSHAIVAEAGLAFLGLGDPVSKSWGMILNRSINFPGIYFTEYWQWWVMAPLLSLTLLVMAVAFVSRDLERLVNHKLEGSGK
ncbi:ABC transporter permease [Desulfosporosinus youngiae]|uniref:ABC-type dipeptide/oligopeptide/nickel transport system, permease component n=1 Tax=Desulfosporosinus youngiae DSM 17734 TaxID=768710 RepID=H5Y454_9FIRM|nr:ABC transporter permease [Desulfosporosinus youngiae]EHQ89735.1 ABC-type dipeptide/oligopeptide/nickel transport system, permease component [Desulfosporosinus youngiae DSM 17734]